MSELQVFPYDYEPWDYDEPLSVCSQCETQTDGFDCAECEDCQRFFCGNCYSRHDCRLKAGDE